MRSALNIHEVGGLRGSPPHQADAVPSIACCLGGLAVLAALALLFPSLLTTPELRPVASSGVVRVVVAGMVAAAVSLGLLSLLTPGRRRASAAALALAAVAAYLLGCPPDATEPRSSMPSLSIDWLVLDLFLSAGVFITLERAFAQRQGQGVFRPGWSLDVGYFAVNHLLAGTILLLANGLGRELLAPIVSPTLPRNVGTLPLWAAVPIILLLADLVQYWVHRSYHASSTLWRIHRIHHSSETMDWLAGSRQHAIELVVTRTLGLAPLIGLGFDKTAIDVAIGVAMVQAVLNHANIYWPRPGSRLAWLRHVFVTPHSHHWHHAAEGANGQNFAALFSFIDRLFRTAADPIGRWPTRYGLARVPRAAAVPPAKPGTIARHPSSPQ